MIEPRLPPLDKYKKNFFSQNGEDGVIDEILIRLNLNSNKEKYCVEFGAWDGVHCSNTYHLVKQGWHAVYIEGDIDRYQDLLVTAKNHQNIQPINEFVDPNLESDKSLDSILKKTAIPSNFELLSIDIDSWDLDIWESLSSYTPIIVVIEVNSGIPPGILYRHSKYMYGNTFSSTLNVGLKKGYQLVCHTGNMIFVRNDYVPKLNIPEKFFLHPELLFDFSHCINVYVKKDYFLTRLKTLIKFLFRK